MSVATLARGKTGAAEAGRAAVLQRRCACAGRGECRDCAKRPTTLQRRADGTADAVPASVFDTLAAPGRPLDAATRTFMQRRIGHDFSGVRVHTDAGAAASARAVGAEAYTVGSNIVFGAGRFVPGTPGGTHLLAHELTHVAQQSGSTAAPAPGQLRISDPGDAAEHEADRVADGVLGAQPRTAAPTPRAPVLARQPMKVPPNPYDGPAEEKKPEADPAPPAEQSVGETTYGSRGRFTADVIRRDAIASKGAQPCTLVATMRIKFVQSDPAAWPSGRFAKWQQEASKLITDRWSMRYLLARTGECANKNEPCRRSVVVVRMQPVASGEHHTVNVRYNKPDEARSNSANWYEPDLKRPRDDMRKSHATANHEFGHLLGLDHAATDTKECKDARTEDKSGHEPDVCYGRDREERAGIMGAGEIVRPRDYEPFVGPMQTATGCTWGVEGKSGPVFGTSGALTGALLGGLAGLVAGAAIGASAGPIGVLVGGLIGAAVGGLLGGAVGHAADQ